MVRLLINFANTLDPDQARHIVGPDLGPNCFTQMSFLKEFFENVNFVKISRQQKACQITQRGTGSVVECLTQDRGPTGSSLTVFCA